MHSTSCGDDFMSNAPPTHAVPFYYPSLVPSPTPTPSPTPSELDAIVLRHLRATISPNDTTPSRSSSAGRPSTSRERPRSSLSPPRSPGSFLGFGRPQRVAPRHSHSAEPFGPPAPNAPQAPFSKHVPRSHDVQLPPFPAANGPSPVGPAPTKGAAWGLSRPKDDPEFRDPVLPVLQVVRWIPPRLLPERLLPWYPSGPSTGDQVVVSDGEHALIGTLPASPPPNIVGCKILLQEFTFTHDPDNRDYGPRYLTVSKYELVRRLGPCSS